MSAALQLIACSLLLQAPALLGTVSAVVMVLWLVVMRHFEAPQPGIDLAALQLLRMWALLILISVITALIQAALGKPLKRLLRRAVLVWAPAALWAYFVIGALLVLHLPPPPEIPAPTPAQQGRLQLTLVAWVGTALLIAIIRFCLHRTPPLPTTRELP